MNKLVTIAVALLVAAAIWLYNQPRPPDGTAAAPAATSQGGTAEIPDPARHGVAVDGNITTGTFDDGTETVLGIRVRKDRNCRVELNDYVTPEGEMFSAYTCTPFEEPAPHPYAHYTDEALAELAYADAEAAALLGQRLAGTDHERSYQLLIRATALDGNTRHLAWLGDVSYGTLRVDGELQVETVMQRYELAALAAQLGEDPGFSLFLRDELLRSGVADDQLGHLDAHVEELLDTVRDIQLTVFGETAIGGQDDA